MNKLKAISSFLFLGALGGYTYYITYYPRPYALATNYHTENHAGGIVSIQKDVHFEIDGQPYTIKTDDRGIIELPVRAGKHTVTRDGKTLGEIDIGWFDGKSIVNLDMKPFVAAEIVYAQNQEKYQKKLESLPTHTITVNGRKYTGPFRYIEPALYLKQDWDYSPAEPTPSEIKSKSGAAVKTELMHLYEFEREFSDAVQ